MNLNLEKGVNEVDMNKKTKTKTRWMKLCVLLACSMLLLMGCSKADDQQNVNSNNNNSNSNGNQNNNFRNNTKYGKVVSIEGSNITLQLAETPARGNGGNQASGTGVQGQRASGTRVQGQVQGQRQRPSGTGVQGQRPSGTGVQGQGMGGFQNMQDLKFTDQKQTIEVTDQTEITMMNATDYSQTQNRPRPTMQKIQIKDLKIGMVINYQLQNTENSNQATQIRVLQATNTEKKP